LSENEIVFSKSKKGENYIHPDTIRRTYGAGRDTLKCFEDYNLSLTCLRATHRQAQRLGKIAILRKPPGGG